MSRIVRTPGGGVFDADDPIDQISLELDAGRRAQQVLASLRDRVQSWRRGVFDPFLAELDQRGIDPRRAHEEMAELFDELAGEMRARA